jgi:nicotinate phosphoribosyltransferase
MLMSDVTTLLLTDLYQLNMIKSYLDHGQTQTAVFEFFVRKLPSRRGFLVAAGLEQALDFLEDFRFSAEEINWLDRTGRFGRDLVEHLATFRFTGDVHAMPEGTIFFANEPILRVTAPLPEAQLAETRLINILHFQSLIASKAARMTLAAPGKLLVDFGLRRAHGAEAGLMAARASYIAGFAGTATMLAEKLYGIPTFGTMAHSFIQAYDDESQAFEDFAKSRPQNLTILIDTYDTEAAAKKVVALAPRLKASGIIVRSVRLDSGDLIVLSKNVRRILDDGGLKDVHILASGGLDEDNIGEMLRAGAPIDAFGIGTSLTTSSDVPALDCAYKLQ